MDREILNEVIEAEKEIQRCIELEDVRLREWLEQVKSEAAEAVARAERDDGEGLEREARAAKEEAERRAKELIAAAEAEAERFRTMDDAALERIVLKQLPKVLLE